MPASIECTLIHVIAKQLALVVLVYTYICTALYTHGYVYTFPHVYTVGAQQVPHSGSKATVFVVC